MDGALAAFSARAAHELAPLLVSARELSAAVHSNAFEVICACVFPPSSISFRLRRGDDIPSLLLLSGLLTLLSLFEIGKGRVGRGLGYHTLSVAVALRSLLNSATVTSLLVVVSVLLFLIENEAVVEGKGAARSGAPPLSPLVRHLTSNKHGPEEDAEAEAEEADEEEDCGETTLPGRKRTVLVDDDENPTLGKRRCADHYTFAEDPSLAIGVGSTCHVFGCRPKSATAAGPLCVKVYNRACLTDPSYDFRQISDREYSTLRGAQHPSIVRLVDLFKERRRRGDPHYSSIYVVMELIPGLPNDAAGLERLGAAARQRALEQGGGGSELFRYLSHRPPLSETALRAVATQLLSALAFIHARDIVHRDIKPDNIAVAREVTLPSSSSSAAAAAAAAGVPVPVIKLMDFGVARTLPPRVRRMDALRQDAAERAGAAGDVDAAGVLSVVGTPGFMPPELFSSSSPLVTYGTSFDIFSAGVTLFMAATGMRKPSKAVRSKQDEADVGRELAEARASRAGAGKGEMVVAPLSDDAVAFVIAMLRAAPDTRPTAADALRADWLDADGTRTAVATLVGDTALLELVGRA
jgi:serine/threonine protein kinase